MTRIAVIAPSPVPFVVGGAERLWWGMVAAFNELTSCEVELFKIPTREHDFWSVVDSYRQFYELQFEGFDMVISTKYPAWMVQHPNHVVYLQHTLRGLYDTYPRGLPEALPAAPELAALQDFLLTHAPTREACGDLFALLERLRTEHADASWAVLPGPVLRAVVHFFDRSALNADQISRHCAISSTVARRSDYFPPGVPVHVVHHPTQLNAPLEPTDTLVADNPRVRIFSGSRLDGAKRMDLLIRAFQRADLDADLYISGSGPQGDYLQQLAEGDARIRFLGRLSDSELREQYQQADVVAFVPYDEDYGLITVEAFNCGKPVVTCSDCGGVTELVEDGQTGLIAQPDEESLAEALRALATAPAMRERMAQNALGVAREITWERMIDTLMGERDALLPDLVSGDRSQHFAESGGLLVVVPFGIYPPRGGGQARIYNFYTELSVFVPIRLLCLAPPNETPSRYWLNEQCEMWVVPKSAEHSSADHLLGARAKASVDDISAIDGWNLTPEFTFQLQQAAQGARAVVASHPYLYRAIKAVWDGPVWYESHNVELDIKRDILAMEGDGGAEQQALLKKVEQVEADCVADAERILAVSDEDLERLSELYRPSDNAPLHCVPNGVVMRESAYLPPSQRDQLRQKLGMEDHPPVAVFVGSWHGPNIEAAEFVDELAYQRPDWQFWVVGSVCKHPAMQEVSDNLVKWGIVSEAEMNLLLQLAHVGVNPITSGSGTNLKLLQYAAMGLPMLTTPFGNRGMPFVAGESCIQVELDAFAGQLQQFLDQASTDAMATQAYRAVQPYAWTRIANTFWQELS